MRIDTQENRASSPHPMRAGYVCAHKSNSSFGFCLLEAVNMLQAGQQDESDEVRFHSPRPAHSYIWRQAGAALTFKGQVYNRYSRVLSITLS
jgi:hypothetical protein